MKKILIVILIGLILSCNKDREVDLKKPSNEYPEFEAKCTEFDIGVCSTTSYKIVDPQYSLPCYNPNNPNEFAYVSDRSLWKFNLETRSKQLLTSNVFPISQPKWSKEGWITLGGSDWNIWVIQDDGTGIKQVSKTPRDLYPEISPKGDRIIYARNMDYAYFELQENPDLRNQYKMMVITPDGNPVDSFCRAYEYDPCFPWNFSSWSSEDLMLAEYGPNNEVANYGLAVYDLNGNEKEIIYLYDGYVEDGKDFVIDAHWHPNGERVIFTDGWGLKSLDLSTANVTLLKESCDSKTYQEFSIHPNGNDILAAVETEKFVLDSCKQTVRYQIIQTSLDGTEERLILIQ